MATLSVRNFDLKCSRQEFRISRLCLFVMSTIINMNSTSLAVSISTFSAVL
ncbi:hypothetical protein K501DRAFT_285767, partial [Backusella circina FSU 941]